MRKYGVLTILLLAVGFIQLSSGFDWTFDQVTNNSESDIHPSIAFIKSAHTYCAYTHNDGNQEVFISINNPGFWLFFRITNNTYTDITTDITSSLGRIQMAHFAIWWQNPPYQGISYGKGNPSGWPVQPVTATTEDCSWPSIEIDKTEKIHISYQKNTGGNQEIFYVNNTSGSWLHEQVTYNSADDLYPWLALDSNSKPHLVFSSGSALHYTEKTTESWSSPELIASGTDSTSHPYIVLDKQNKAHICFSKSDGNDEEVYYVNNLSGSWQESKVTDNDFDDLYPTIFVDPNKKGHIAYMAVEPNDAEIYYANNTTGTWVAEPVTNNDIDDNSYYGRYFLPDSLCRGHIYFCNNQDGDNEIYHARSHDPLYVVGVDETSPAIMTSSLEVNPTLFSTTTTTTISYSVPAAGNVSLKIYDVAGSLIKTLVRGTQQKGTYRIIWDGSTNTGIHASPGVYFYQLSAGAGTTSMKGILK